MPLDGSGVILTVTPGAIERTDIDPAELSGLGLARGSNADLAGGTPDENAALVEAVLGGARGAHRDVVLLNAAAGLVAAGSAPTLGTGLAMAEAALDDGRAVDLLGRLRLERTAADAARATAVAEAQPEAGTTAERAPA